MSDNIQIYLEYWRGIKKDFDKSKKIKAYKSMNQLDKIITIFDSDLLDKTYYPKQLQDILVYSYGVCSNSRWNGEMILTSEQNDRKTKQTGLREYCIKIGLLEQVMDKYDVLMLKVLGSRGIYARNKRIGEKEKKISEQEARDEFERLFAGEDN